MIFTDAINELSGKTWVKHIWQIYKNSSKYQQSQNSLQLRLYKGCKNFQKIAKQLIFCLTSRGSLVRIQ